MKNLVRFTLVALVLASLVGAVHTARADASDDVGTVTGITCNGAAHTVTITVTTNSDINIDVDVDLNGSEVLDFDEGTTGGTFTQSDPRIVIGSVVTVEGTSLSATCSNSAVFCAVGADGRINGLCGDRVAVYCNTSSPANLDVWGIGNNSIGFDLKKFTVADLIKAGPKGISTNLGALGVVSVSLDAQNNFWVSWLGQINPLTGGTFFANGQPAQGFAKGGQCNFAR